MLASSTPTRFSQSQIRVGTTASPGSLFNRGYVYDAVGNIGEINVGFDVNQPHQEFVYDSRDRLTRWSKDCGGNPAGLCQAENYTYNQIGNLTNKAGVSYTYGAKPHAVTNVGGNTYNYDANGNLTAGGGRSYGWKAENMPLAITATNVTEQYRYDAEASRVERRVVTSTAYTPPNCAISFTDVTTANIYYEDIRFAVCQSFMSGISNGNGTFRFEPNSNISRANFAEVAVKAFGIQSYTPSTATFSDVPTSHSKFTYVESVARLDVMPGLNSAQCSALGVAYPCFGPSLNVSRGQAANAIYKARGYTPYTPSTATFMDVPTSSIYFTAIETVANQGIITGAACPSPQTGLCFRPNDNIRRGELSSYVHKAAEKPLMITSYVGGSYEVDSNGTTRTLYSFNGGVVAQRTVSSTNNTLVYLSGDHLGSVSLVTSNTGTQLSSNEFDPWGKQIGGDTAQTKLNFTGQRKDDTGLLFYNARYYDPILARFVSADSIVPGMTMGSSGAGSIGADDAASMKGLTVDYHETGFASAASGENAMTLQKGFWFQLSSRDRQKARAPFGPGNPQALNRYSYVLNNPLRYTDPTGHGQFIVIPAGSYTEFSGNVTSALNTRWFGRGVVGGVIGVAAAGAGAGAAWGAAAGGPAGPPGWAVGAGIGAAVGTAVGVGGGLAYGAESAGESDFINKHLNKAYSQTQQPGSPYSFIGIEERGDWINIWLYNSKSGKWEFFDHFNLNFTTGISKNDLWSDLWSAAHATSTAEYGFVGRWYSETSIEGGKQWFNRTQLLGMGN